MDNKNKIDKNKYRFPVYIHSHSTALEQIQNSDTLKIVVNKVDEIKQKVISNMETAISSLKRFSNEDAIQAYYQVTHDDKKGKGYRVMPPLFNMLIDLIIKYRNTADEKIQENINKAAEQILSQGKAQGQFNIYDYLANTYGEAVAENVAAYLSKDNHKKKYDLQKVLWNDIENDSYLKKMLIKSIAYNLKDILPKSQEAKELMELIVETVKIEQGLLEVKEPQTLKAMILKREQYYDKLMVAITGGFLFEYVLYVYFNSGIEVTVNINGKPTTLQLSAKDTGTSSHESTTDIVLVLQNGKKNYQLGMSAKANMTNGQASNVFHKDLRGKPPITKENDYKELMYILGNYKALSVFAVDSPETYEKVIDTADGEVNIPTMDTLKIVNIDWLYKLQESYTYTTFVKALVGQMLNDNPSLEGKLKKEPALWLSFLEYDYWTWEILEAILSLIKENSSLLKQYIKYASFQWEDPVFESLNYDNLKSLFLAKKMTEAKTQNRYQDFLSNDINHSLSLTTGVDKNVVDILTEIHNTFNRKGITNLLFPVVRYSIPINELVV